MDIRKIPQPPKLPKLYARAAQIKKAILDDQPNASLSGWLGYFHYVDQTLLKANCLTFPSKNCFIPQKDKIVPRAGKTLLGQAYTAGQDWPIVGRKERFATMGGKVVEVRVTKTNNIQLGDIIEVLYPNPLTGALQWYTITEGAGPSSQNPFLPGLHEYYFDDWLDTDLNPAKSLNVSRLIWTNGNNQIYSWVGAIAEIVAITTVIDTGYKYFSVDTQRLALSTQTGTFQVGEKVNCGSGTGASFYVSAINGDFLTMILVNLGSGSNPFPVGGTIVGVTSGATGVIGTPFTKPILKTWGQLGFYDPSSHFDNVIINGIAAEFISTGSPTPLGSLPSNQYNSPDIYMIPVNPTGSVGDLVISHPRADGNNIPTYYTPNAPSGLSTTYNFINLQIPNIPFDICKNYKGYMMYGNWVTRAVYQSNALAKDANIEVVFQNAILDDLFIPSTSEYLYAQFPTDYVAHTYVVTIVSVVTDNQYIITKDGIITLGGSIPVGGIIHLDANFTSLTAQFFDQGGHTLGDTWTIQVTPVVNTAWADFFYSLPVRIPGEGYVYTIQSNFWAMDVQEGDLYVNTQYGDWYYINTTLSVTTNGSSSETISITPLKQASVSKVIYPYMIGHLDNDMVFVTTDKTIDMIGRRQFLELPQIGYLSQPVEADFKALSFKNGSIKYWQKLLYITSPVEETMMVYDNKAGNKYWQPPQDFAENGILSIVNDMLITHSNLRNQSFVLFNGPDENGDEYTVIMRTPANAYGSRWGTKITNKSFLEGYVTNKPPLVATAYVEIDGAARIIPHDVEPILIPQKTRAPIGQGSLGSHQLGSDKPTNAPQYFREIASKPYNPIMQWYFLALELSCTCKNHSYSILSMGVNYVPGNLGNNPYIPKQIISEQ